MDSNEIDLDFLRYTDLQEEYRAELEGGRIYVAKRVGESALAPQFDIFLPSGAPYSRQVLPSGLEDVELYFLGFFTWLDAKTFAPVARKRVEPTPEEARAMFVLPKPVQHTPVAVKAVANIDAMRYTDLQEEYLISLESDRTYVAKRADASEIAPQFDLFLPSGARYGRHTLPSGVEDVELYFIGFFTWLDVRS